MERTKIKGIQITYNKNFMVFKKSYQISNIDKMKAILDEALEKPTSYYTKRTKNSLIKEWISHNILYKLHLFRSHTADTDFEREIKKTVAFCYFILSFPFLFKYFLKKIYLKIKKKYKEKQYIRYIKNHQKNIKKAYKELINTPNIYLITDKEILDKLYKRVLVHDNSKFSKEEFDAYRRYYYPINKEEKENSIQDFEKAWEHHWKNNSHHWQYRQKKKTFNRCNDEEFLDLLENVIDWLAMGYKFKDRPYEYYEKNKENIFLCHEEKEYLEHIIYDILENKEKN